MTESPQTLPVVNTDVVFRRVGDGGVLLSLEDEVYYGLNAVGARVWELLQESYGDLEELVSALHREYDEVDRNVISEDVSELLRDLTTSGLLRPGVAVDP